MKTLIFILLSFQSFAQIDTIQCPCDMTRQQTRLYYSAVELALKLKDDQHERENTKEIKALKYGLRTERVNRRTEKDRNEYQIDSLKRSNALELKKERNRHQETVKTLTNEKKEVQRKYSVIKSEQKNDRAKIRLFQYIIIALGAIGILFLVLLIRKNR